jgi:hypothetical protein
MPKFDSVNVSLIGKDGNAFAILGAVAKAMRKAGVGASEIDAYQKQAMSGDYNHLLRVTMDTVNVE